MDAQPLTVLRLLFPKLPLLLKVTILHLLRLSEPARFLDLRTELVVSVLRSLLNPSSPRTISSTQRLAIRDPGIKGKIWVSKYTANPPPETSIRDALLSAVSSLGESAVHGRCRIPDLVPVEAEWTGYRAAATEESSLPSVSERSKFEELERECTSPTTILYFHGGAYYLMDPATHRPATKKLARLTGGRCYSVRYRLAPQNPFPAALLDALVSYFALLYPPPDAFHQPIQPACIVFAGDSAGGNLCLALLQTLLEFRRQGLKITWYGAAYDVPLPAGVAVNSPWLDLTLSSPSWETNAAFDYLPNPSSQQRRAIPPCEVWPANPPRLSLYVDDDLLSHPLVTLIPGKSWKGSPPVFLCTGRELLTDEAKFLASKLDRDGAIVVFEEYEAMPHCFALIFARLPAARRCFEGWSGFLKASAEDPASLSSRAVTIRAKKLEEVQLDLASLSALTEDQVRTRVREQIRAKIPPPAPSKL